MHPYFLYKRIGKIFLGLCFLSIILLIIIPSGTVKLISLLLIIVFLVLALVFFSKSLSFNKEEEKVFKENLVEKTKSIKKLI